MKNNRNQSSNRAFRVNSTVFGCPSVEVRNYLFCGNHRAARDAAIYYTFFGSCKLAKVNQLEWLTYVLEKINETKINDIYKLFPQNWKDENTENPEV